MPQTLLFLVIIALIPLAVTGQEADSSTASPAPAGFSFSGYVEAYYSHDLTASSTANERPFFLYNHKRNREVNLNLAYIRGAYTGENIRANVALQAGTYPQYNYAAEQELIKPLFEANAGVKLSRKADVWLDAGLFPSFIGFESAVSKNCWTLTRSIVAENSPYYLAGAKLSYSTRKWFLLGAVLNGWQRVRRLQGYSGPSFGTQLQYKPSDAVTLNWSTFWGKDQPDSVRGYRMYHNLYSILQIGKAGIILGFDIGKERHIWYTPVIIVRYPLTSTCNLAARAEYYDDRYGIIVKTGTGAPFQTWGYSLNVDYSIRPQALWRLEGRVFSSRAAIFDTASGIGRTNAALTTSLAVSF